MLSDQQIRDFITDEGIDEGRATRHWTQLSVVRMVSAVRHDMRPRDRPTLDEPLGARYLIANLLTHNSPASISSAVSTRNFSSRRPSDLLVHDALSVAYDAMCLLAALVAEDKALAELDEIVDRDRPLFTPIQDSAESGETTRAHAEWPEVQRSVMPD